MKVKKLLKCSLAIALIFGSVGVLAGCGKDDNKTETLTEQEKIYKLAVDSGYEGTYEQWLATIKGAKGDKGNDGHTPEITIGEDNYWYVDGVSTNVKATGGVGATGDRGATWLTGTVAPNDNNGEDGDFYYDSLAKKIYNKVSGAWSLVTTIVNGNDGNGISGVTKTTNGNVDTYTINYTDGNSYSFNVTNGTNGTNAKDVIFDVENGWIRWAYDVQNPQWENLVEISTLKGGKGDTGENGKEVIFQVTEGRIEWAYDEDVKTWNTLIELGPTWSSGEGGSPAVTETTKIGDFYFDTLNNDIYIYTNEGWKLQVDMEVKEEAVVLSEGTYVNIVDENIIEAVLGDNNNIISLKTNMMSQDGSLFDITEYITEFSVLGENLVKIVITLPEYGEQGMYFSIGEEVEYNNGIATEIIEYTYISDEDYVLINGSYQTRDNEYDRHVLNISKNKVLAYVFGINVNGNIEYDYVNVEYGYVSGKITSDKVSFDVELNLFNKEFNVDYESIVYNFEGVYTNYAGSGKIKLIKTEQGYNALFNDDVTTFVVNNVSEDGLMYATMTVNETTHKLVLSLAYGQFQFYVDSAEIENSLEENTTYILNNYYNKNLGYFESNNVNEDYFYTAVGYTESTNVTDLMINQNSYTSENISFSVGNGNFINLPSFKVENGKIYVASLILKTEVLKNEGLVNVLINNTEYVHVELEEYSNNNGYVMLPEEISTGIHLSDENSERLERYDENYYFVSNNGTKTIRFYLGEDTEFNGDEVAYVTRNVNGTISHGYSALDKIGNSYYLVFYPYYVNGDYTNELLGGRDVLSYNIDYSIVLSNGKYGSYRLNINLFDPITNQEISSSVNNVTDYINDNYYNLENASGEQNIVDIDDSYFYTAVGYASDVKYVTIGGNTYDYNLIKFSIGNNNFIEKSVIKCENGKLYVAALVLKSHLLSTSSDVVVNVTNYNEEVNDIIINSVGFDSINYVGEVNGTNGTLTNNDGTYNYASNKGTDYIMFNLGDNPELANAAVFTSKCYSNGDSVYSSSYGYSTLDKIGDNYYLIFYPYYVNGNYTETHFNGNTELEYKLIYTFVSSSGEAGHFEINVRLLAE